LEVAFDPEQCAKGLSFSGAFALTARKIRSTTEIMTAPAMRPPAPPRQRAVEQTAFAAL